MRYPFLLKFADNASSGTAYGSILYSIGDRTLPFLKVSSANSHVLVDLTAIDDAADGDQSQPLVFYSFPKEVFISHAWCVSMHQGWTESWGTEDWAQHKVFAIYGSSDFDVLGNIKVAQEDYPGLVKQTACNKWTREDTPVHIGVAVAESGAIAATVGWNLNFMVAGYIELGGPA